MERWKVRFFNYPAQFQKQSEEYMKIIKEVLYRGSYILGEELERFEENLANFVGTKYAIGVSNCTDALLLSLIAVGISKGDEVITVSHTFVATVEVIKFLGAEPIFADITEDHNMDVESVEKIITPKTKAIIPVQLNGRVCSRMDKLIEIANKYNIFVIEDSAQALGAKYESKNAGTFGITGNFSFYPAKILGAFGDAGAIVTNDKEIAKKIRKLRNHGRDKSAEVELWGLNCRMDNLQAAILDYKLQFLPDNIKKRREIAMLYHQGLSDVEQLRLPPSPSEESKHYDVFQNYEIEAENRDNLMNYLRKHGIEVGVQWGGKAVHQFSSLGLDGVRLPRTEEVFKKALLLPIYPELEDWQIEYVIEKIKEFYYGKS